MQPPHFVIHSRGLYVKKSKWIYMGSFMIKDIICGVKESGTGREGIKYAIEEMTEMKPIFIKK
ncbi:hypothetical protein COM49_17605 [Bacillus pseudomycoides]|nr:hypothetical protein COO06_25750 [Bacillus pseudomycoides]PGD91723.1 hypothetical protein COM50_22695 [Bacillus pseudomycoides]PGE01585.1 hypothetical protein COM49_17605 [Bacillus pseudomycoides]PHE67405.1 hypothetical protein COF69_14660 [Bacillus pseudomycoides]PHG25235.1 hypothetical protein COI47_06640 [Bacillus pseudomycoides]